MQGTRTALAPTRLANGAGLRQIGNDANASTASQSSNLQGVRASVLTRSDNAAAHLADAQSEQTATASQSGKSQGEAPPPSINTAPVLTLED